MCSKIACFLYGMCALCCIKLAKKIFMPSLMARVTKLFFRDFRQFMVLIWRGTHADYVNASLKYLCLWPQVEKLSLATIVQKIVQCVQISCARCCPIQSQLPYPICLIELAPAKEKNIVSLTSPKPPIRLICLLHSMQISLFCCYGGGNHRIGL